MAYQISSPEITQPMQRMYTDLKGVDFSSIPSRVATYRSPDAKNVYKNYLSELGQAIETRPGIEILGCVAGIYDNMLLNWNFIGRTSKWTASSLSGFSVDDETKTAGILANAQHGYIKQNIADYEKHKNHKLFMRAKIKSTSSSAGIYIVDSQSSDSAFHTGSGTYENICVIRTVNENADWLEVRLQDDRTGSWDMISVYEVILIDLTARFGAGNEPDLAVINSQIDAMLAKTDNNIYGIHVLQAGKALIHCGDGLYIWNKFPNSITYGGDISATNITMEKAFSNSFTYRVYDEQSNTYKIKLYIMDGKNYLEYDGTKVSHVTGYIPTTSIGASPDGSGRVAYQGVNYISDFRKNTFSADGTDTYCVDATDIDSDTDVIVKVFDSTINDWVVKELTTQYTVNTDHGTVEFTAGNIPQAPSTPGSVNVEITYKKQVFGYSEHILYCTLAKVFDNRVFLSGNDSYKGVLFHSELDNPAYFSDENWYFDGADNSSIKSIVAASDKMVCIKEDLGQGVKVYYHTVSYDSTYGNIYPVSETEIHLGACCEGINFRDTIVYLSKQGLESIYSTSELLHKSSLIDTKLINEAGLEDAKMAIWNNYLCILINGRIYLADSRQQTEAGQYEWYYWDNIGIWRNKSANDNTPEFKKAIIIKEYDNKLFMGTENGHIFTFGGTANYFEETGAPLMLKQSSKIIENIVLNGNFSIKDPVENIVWQALEGAEISIENNIAEINCIASSAIKQTLDYTKYAGKSIYICAMVKSTSNIVRLESYDDIGGLSYCCHSGSGKYEFLSLIKNVPSSVTELDIRITDGRTSGWDDVYAQNVIAFDLSTIYGGSIPEKSAVDSFINGIFKNYSIDYFKSLAYSSELFEIKTLGSGRGRILTFKGNAENIKGNINIKGLSAERKVLQENIVINGTSEQNTSNEYIIITDIYSPNINSINDITLGLSNKMIIESYWTTPMDVFNTLTHLKTTNKRGSIVQIKRIPNSVFKLDVLTDKESWQNILTSYTTGFSFENLRLFLLGTPGYDHISFGTGVRGYLVFKVKKRKIKYFSIKFYSDELGMPFGLYEATIEFTVDNYVKK